MLDDERVLSWQFYVVGISGNNITISDRRGNFEPFKLEEVGLLHHYGVLIDKVIDSNKGIVCRIHSKSVDLAGELYVEHIASTNHNRIKVRNFVTNRSTIWGIRDVSWFLQNVGPILGATIDKEDRNAVSFLGDVYGTVPDTARFSLVTGLHGLVYNKTLFKVYLPCENYEFTPGDFCDTIVSNSLVVSLRSHDLIVRLDNRVKSLDSTCISGNASAIKLIVQPDMSEDVLVHAYMCGSQVEGLDGRDDNFYTFTRQVLLGYRGVAPKYDTLDRFTARYKEAMLRELKKDSNYLSRNVSVVNHLLAAAADDSLHEVGMDFLRSPFVKLLITPYYIKAGGKDKEIIDAYVEGVSKRRG